MYQIKSYTYPSDTDVLPSQINTVVYNEKKDTLTTTDGYTYDRAGNLTKSISDSTGKKITTEYTYSSKYYLPTMKKYDTDADKKVIERYTLTEDTKNIAQRTIYESVSGGAEQLKEQSDYLYYPEGMLQQETAYLVEDGVASEASSIHYEYADNCGRSSFDGLNLTKRSTVNHKKVDGDANIISTDETIAEQYYYDGYDNLIKVIDPNGNVTESTYTVQNKISKIKNPDGSEKHFDYIVGLGDNRIIQTDENGHGRELVYDVFGKLRHERDKTTNQLLMSYEYNYYGDIVSAFDYINSKSSYYTYNPGYRTLKNIETRDEETWFAQHSPTYQAGGTNQDKTGWKYYNGVLAQYLTKGASYNKFDDLEQTLKVDSGDYLFVKAPAIDNALYVSFKINGVWTDEKTWRISTVDANKMAVKSVDDLGLAGQEIQGIQFHSDTTSSSYITRVGVLRGKSESKQLQNVNYDYDYADNSKYIKMTRTVEGDTKSQSVKETSYIDKLGNVVKQQQYAEGNTIYTSDYTYDYRGNVLTERSPRANAENWTEPTAQYAYDYTGRCISSQNADGNTAYTAYDSLGRMVSQTDFNQSTVNYEYDTLGREIKQSTILDTINGTDLYYTKLTAYDNNGNVTSQWTSNNKAGEAVSYDKVAYEYNNKNQLAKAAAYKDSTTADYTQYYYDAAGNQIRLYTGLSSPLTISGVDSVSGNSDYSVIKYEYDYLNRPVKTIDALGQEETYVPNYNGTIDSATDRNGNITTNTYDSLARLLTTEVLSTVYHGADWDIKRPGPWNTTIGSGTFPGFGTQVYYYGVLMTPEELGNYTYGYIGAALQISLSELYVGSWVAAGLPITGEQLANEFTDWDSITRGFYRY